MKRIAATPVMLAGALLTTTVSLSLVLADDSGKPDGDGDRRSSLVQRPARPLEHPPHPRRGAAPPAAFPNEFRSIDGTYNNPMHPTWGAAGITLLRLTPEQYADGIGDVPGGAGRESARAISNAMCTQTGDAPNHRGATAYLWQWGQFIDHDIDETPITNPAEQFDIPVPVGDPWFDPGSTGNESIALDRSAYQMVNGMRQQLNNITSYLDGSNVYGADQPRADELRTHDGTGMLKTSAGNLLPFNVNGFDNAPTANDPSFFLAGDVRCNEQVALTAMHTLFMREHNHHAVLIRAEYPNMTGDEIYERARAIVAAELQVITYNEFLPMLLGPNALPDYTGYDPMVDAGISNVFATAAYRVGHTLLSSPLMRIDAAGDEVPAGHLALADGFFAPQQVIDHGIDPLLRGLAKKQSQDVDCRVLDDVRNFLFGPPGAGGFDLASLNIQRGRDHGLASYNDVRVSFGRPAAQTFADISPDPQVQASLASMYSSVNDIDAWVGMLAEPHRPGAMVGETLWRVLRDQFTRLRDGDRFWYQSYLPPEMVQKIETQSRAKIIRRNTAIGAELPDDVFHVPPLCAADVDHDGSVGIGDLFELLAVWGPCLNCPADLNSDGVVDVFDLFDLLGSWGPCQ